MSRSEVVENLRQLRDRLYLHYSLTEGEIEERIAWAKVDLIDELIGVFS